MGLQTAGKELLALTEKAVSPFHTVAAVEEKLKAAGFEELFLNRDFGLDKGRGYYVKQGGSTLVAFTIGSAFSYKEDFRIAAAHTDFPALCVKTSPELTKEGYRQLNVEVYGGAILNTWLDRPLSAAGRVALKSGDMFHPHMRLVDFHKPFLVIPNLAIHLNKEVNKGVELNRQKDMLPICGLAGEDAENTDFFMEYLARELQVEKEEILDFELYLYNTEQGCTVGMEEELILAPRLDNLTSVQAVLAGILMGRRKRGVNVAAFFDHEEIGSRTKQGAGSVFLSQVLERIFLFFGQGREAFLPALADSLLLSVDVGHGLHPNQVDKNDITNKNILNQGICIKEACSQSYATDSEAVAIVQQLCAHAGVPYQKFVNRSDGTSGSTLGSIASSVLPVKTVDVGVPLLAMHSAKELMGAADQEGLQHLMTAFFEA